MLQRKRIQRSWWSVLVTMAMLLSLVSTAFATDSVENTTLPVEKIESALMSEMASKGATTFWVYFDTQVDLSHAYQIDDWAERGQYVYDTLRKHAANSQADTIAYLEKVGAKYESFWIANTVKVEGNYNVLMDLAGMSGIKTMTTDKVYALETPFEGKAEPKINAVEWGIANIKADQVWSTFGIRGEGIVVGSIDTGVMFNHPALVNQYRGNNGDGTFNHNYNWHDPSNVCGSPSLVPCDNNGHGTHVHGTMVGYDGGANEIGVAPAAQWMAAKGCESGSCSQSALLSSGQFMVAPTNLQGQNADPSKRPHVLNNSWGGGSTNDPWYAPTVEAWVAAGIFPQFANGNAGPGCATAGNPGNHPLSYASGAYDISNNIASFSSRGASAWGGIIKPNISAPGVNIRSAWPGGGYNSISGTSMASPHVAGAVALMMSAAPSLIGDVDAVRALLDASAIDTSDLQCGGTPGNNNVFGEGRLDALLAVDMSPRGPVGTLAGTVTDAVSGNPIAGAAVSAAGESNRTANTNAAGQYSFTLPVGSYSMTVTRFGYDASSATNVGVAEGGTTTQDFALQPAAAGSLSGVVRDPSSQPIAGARVEILGSPIPAATTGSDGSYSFSSVPNGTYQVMASAGRCSDSQTLTANVDGSTTLNFSLPGRSDAFGYTCSIVDRAFEQAANLVPVSGDDASGPISLPFPFAFYGQTYNNGWVCTNGIVGFGSSASCPFSNSGIPSIGAPNAAIYPFWDDLMIDSSASIRSELKGEAPNRRFVIEFRNATFFGASSSRVDFNVVLYENGQIMTQYANLDDARERGNSATVGIENHTGTVAFQYSFNEDVLFSGLSILYRLPPSGFIAGMVTDYNDGLPISGATVKAMMDGSVIRSVQTNAAGEYLVQVPLGDYTVEASGNNYGTASQPVSVQSEAEQTNASFSLTTARAAVDPGALTFVMTPGKSQSQTVTITNTGSAPLDFTAGMSGGGRTAGAAGFSVEGLTLNPEYDANAMTAAGKYLYGTPAGGAPAAPGDIIASWTASGLDLAWGIGYDGNVWISDPLMTRNHEFTVDGAATGKTYNFNWGGSWIADMADMGGGVMCQVNVGGDNGIYCWNTANGSLVGSITSGGAWAAISQRGLAYQPDGDFFYIGGWNQDILYKVKGLSHGDKGAVVSQCSYPGISISGLAYNPTAHVVWIATNSQQDTIHMVNPDTCAVEGALAHPTPGFNGAGLAMDDQGNLWVSNQNSRTMYLLDSGVPHSTDVSWLAISPEDGMLAPGQSMSVNVTADTTGMDAGVYTATITLRTNGGRQANISIPVTLVLSAYQQSVNVGGSQAYIDVNGDVWDADKMYTAGSYGYTDNKSKTQSTKSAIAGTDDDALFQTARLGAGEYRFDLPQNGFYEVELNFAEIQGSGNNRTFDVLIEGGVVLYGYNIASAVGRETADTHVFLVEVTDGQLNIVLAARRGQTEPMINAIRVTHRSDL